MIKSSRTTALLFIDTYQNSAGVIVAIALKLRITGDDWLIHLRMEGLVDVDAEALRNFYRDIPKSPWLQAYLDSPHEFVGKNFYLTRYQDQVKFLSEPDFLEALYEYDFTLIDLGESAAWFSRFVRGQRFSYSVRSFSLLEIGDERSFELPPYYSKTDLNEIASRIDSIKGKIQDLRAKFGDSVFGLESWKKLVKFVKR